MTIPKDVIRPPEDNSAWFTPPFPLDPSHSYFNDGEFSSKIVANIVTPADAELLKNFEIGRLRLGFLVAIVLFNWTEATFKTLHPVWFVFYIIAMDYPRSQLRPAQPLAFEGFEEERELAYTEFREGSEGI